MAVILTFAPITDDARGAIAGGCVGPVIVRERCRTGATGSCLKIPLARVRSEPWSLRV
jgi:hypothetical protein